MKKFEFLEHTGDIKFRSYGKSLNEVFENIALAMSNFLTGGQKVKSKIKKPIEVSGHDKESLLYNYIEEIIFLLDSENFLISKAKVEIKNNSLKGTLSGDNALDYEELDQIKSATYHDMYIKKTQKGWEAQTVVDV